MAKRKILILAPMIGIGDLVWVKPWIDAAADQHDVVLMTKPSSHAHITMQEHINKNNQKKNMELHPLYRSMRGQKGKHDGISGIFRLARDIIKIKPDEVWIFHRSWRYAAAAWLARVKKRIGFGLGRQQWFLTEPSPIPDHMEGIHPRKAVASILNPQGICPKDTHPRLKANAEQIALAKATLPANTPTLIMGVGCSTADRRWSPKHFADVINWLHQSYPNYHIALCGGPDEQDIGEQVLKHVESKPDQVQLIFDQPLGVVVGILQLSALYIGNDTSLINIAAAVGTRCVRIYASSLPILSSEYITSLWPADKSRISVWGSIDDITPNDVIDAVKPLLN